MTRNLIESITDDRKSRVAITFLEHYLNIDRRDGLKFDDHKTKQIIL